jgi:beta-glucanase (GH16 family)
LLWSDEFDGDSLDRSRWCTRYAHGGGAALEIPDADCTGPGGINGTGDFLKDERQRYRDHNTRGEALHVVSNGHLTLRATKTGKDSYAAYESALVRSKLAIRPSSEESYYITSRMRLPSTQGSFAALWLSSGYGDNGVFQWPPEVDILEAAMNGIEDKENMIRVGVAVKGAQTDSGAEEVTASGRYFDKEWNNYTTPNSLRDVWVDVAHEWTASGVCTYINGELALCENYRWVDNSGKSANPANVILNLAVGGEWAGRHGIDDTKPMQMDVDYLRVYKKSGAAAAAPTPSAPSTPSTPPSTGDTGSGSTSPEPSDPGGSTTTPTSPWWQRWFFWR